MAVDGNDDFRDVVLPSLIRPGMRIYDVGGGARPYISAAQRAAMGLEVAGLDISAEELHRRRTARTTRRSAPI